MSYDGLDRLTQTTAPNQWWISATTTYDPLDNIRTNQVGNTASFLNTYTYDPATWHLTNLTGHVNWTLGYDAHGNVTGKGAGNAAYVFDAADRLQSVTGKESYRYDGYGRRVKVTRTSDGKTDYPIYTMGGQLLTEDDQRSNTRTDYVSLNGSLVAKRSAALGASTWTTTYEHTDALHSPTEETNAAGTATRIEHYTPYGEPGDHQYVQGPGYTGHVTDAATGLTYAQQRYYDPVVGRFLSVDPVQADDKGGDFNRYWYAADNPYRFVDPDGRAGCTPGVGTHICGNQAITTETAATSAEDKTLQNSTRTGEADKSNPEVSKVNNGLKSAAPRVSHIAGATNTWNKTDWVYDPAKVKRDNPNNPRTAAYSTSEEPLTVYVGHLAQFEQGEYVYNNAYIKGGAAAIEFIVLHEFGHVWNRQQGYVNTEDSANRFAYLALPQSDRDDITCRTCALPGSN